MGSKKKKKALRREQKQALKKSALSKRKTEISKSENKKRYLALIGILLFTFMCFSPSLNNEFVNWDDDRNFYDNELITSLNQQNFWENTARIFKSDVIGGYNPLTIWTFLLEHKIFTLDQPMYWHLDNIILHLLCCFFVFWISFRMKLGKWGSIVLTLLFAVHPMRVESVAWVTERKDVLYGVFYLAAIFYYLKIKQDGYKLKYGVIISICFALSLFAKIQAVILPISLVLIDYYLSENARISVSSVLKKWAYFLGALAFGILGIYFLKDQGSIEQEYTGISRIFIGSYSLLVYYVKALIPYRLSPLYPYPAKLDWYFYVSIFSFLLTALVLWQSYIKKKRVIFWGLAFFIANIVLLLQILGAGQGFLADRFSYMAYLGLFFIMAWYFEDYMNKYPGKKTLFLSGAALLIMIYGTMTYQQNKIWKNSETLWTHVLKYYTKTTLPWGNRANHYRDNGMVEKALYDYSQVIRLKPDKPEAYNSRARLYFNYNQRDSLLKALTNYNKAISLRPDDVEFMVNRGATHAKLGNTPQALQDLAAAENLDPSFANIYLNRSVIYNNSQEWDKALSDIVKYLQYKPNNPDMWYEKARLHAILGDFNSSMQAFDQALAMRPNSGLYHYEKARVLFLFKQYEPAKTSIQTALRLGYKGDQNLVNRILNTN